MSIPIIINNRNRLTSLRDLVNWFLSRGYDRIMILDNQSTYPPLLEYYNSIEDTVQIFRLRNLLSKALWCWPESRKVICGPFIYTDSDIVPAENCPDDLVDFLIEVSKAYGMPNKVGLSLKIDDIPDCYSPAPIVRAWEGQFWERQIGDVKGIPIYSAAVDTTLAYYPEFQPFLTDAIRVGAPYIARHAPWYVDSNNLSEEERFYVENAASGCHTWSPDDCVSHEVREFYSKLTSTETEPCIDGEPNE